MSETYVCNLSPELKEKAEKEVNEKDSTRQEEIQALRDLVIAHKGLTAQTDDAFLLRFLRARKFFRQDAYDLLVNYYTTLASNPDVFGDITPESVSRVFDDGIACVLPKRDSKGRCIIYIRVAKWDPSAYPFTDVVRNALINLEVAIQDDETQINGIVIIENLENIGFSHATGMDMKSTKILSNLTQDAFPMRYEALHMVRQPAVFSMVYKLMKLFMSEETAKKMHIHGSSLDEFHNEFKPDMLPPELGGTLPDTDQLVKEWKAKVMSQPEVFERFKKYKIELQTS